MLTDVVPTACRSGPGDIWRFLVGRSPVFHVKVTEDTCHASHQTNSAPRGPGRLGVPLPSSEVSVWLGFPIAFLEVKTSQASSSTKTAAMTIAEVGNLKSRRGEADVGSSRFPASAVVVREAQTPLASWFCLIERCCEQEPRKKRMGAWGHWLESDKDTALTCTPVALSADVTPTQDCSSEGRGLFHGAPGSGISVHPWEG